MILIVVLYAILASTFVFAKYAVQFATPTFLIGFRMVLASVMLLSFCLIKGSGKLGLKPEDYGLFFKTALFHIYVAFTLEFWALQYVGALKTTMIFSITPFVAALLAYLLYNERLNKTKKCGILIGAAGLVPVLLSTGEQLVARAGAWHSISLPDIALLGAVISSAYAWFLVKQLMHKGYSFVLINGIAMLVGGLMSLLTSIVLDGFVMPVSNWPAFLWWVLLLVISANVIVYNLYGSLLRYYSITFLTFAGFLCPSFGAVYEWLLTGKAISWHYMVSLVLVMMGLYIFYRQELINDYAAKK